MLDDVNTTGVSHKPLVNCQASTQSYVPNRQKSYFLCENTNETSKPSSREQKSFEYQQTTGIFSPNTHWLNEKDGNSNKPVVEDPTLDRRALYNRRRDSRDPYQGSPSDGQGPRSRYGIRDCSIQGSSLNHRVLSVLKDDIPTTIERTVRKRPPELQSTRRPSNISPYSGNGVGNLRQSSILWSSQPLQC